MRKRWRVGAAVAIGLATLVVGGWFLYTHLFPIPLSWVGIWENETQLISAVPGDVRLVISREGKVDLQFDRKKYVWLGVDQFHLRHIRGDLAELWPEPHRSMRLRIEVQDGRMTVSDPEPPDPPRPARPDDVMVFRRVTVP